MASEWARARDIALGLVRSAADQARDKLDDVARAQSRDFWVRAARDLTDQFTRLTDALSAEFRPSSTVGGGPGGEYFDHDYPLTWTGSLSKAAGRSFASIQDAFTAAAPDPEITIRVDFRRDGTGLRHTCEIFVDGRVLRHGPAGLINAPRDAIGAQPEIRSALRQITDFIAASEPFIREQLRELP